MQNSLSLNLDTALVYQKNDRPLTDSRIVAKCFKKRHADVIRDIEMLDCSADFRERNFALSSYRSEQNKKMPMYAMTFDGFIFLAMGYRGKKAAQLKESYIAAFNQMEQFIKTLSSARQDYPLLTDNVKMLHEEPKPYHFINECNLINQVALGMTAKAFRKAHSIDEASSIRPYLTPEQIALVDALQKVDIGLLLSVPDYMQRKRMLEWYKMKYEQKQLA